MKKRYILMCLMLLTICFTTVCHAESHVHSGGTATCEHLAVCAECGKSYGHLAAHSWGAWVSDGSDTHTRTCQTNAGHKETRYHMGGASSCTEGAKCAMCGAVHDEPLGHVPVNFPGYAATCISSGLADGVSCSRCGDVLTARRVINATGHSYNAWLPSGDGTHFAVCNVSDCGDATAVMCTPWEVTANGALLTACPICGSVGSQTMPVLLAQPHPALPIGQLLVRGMAEPFPGALYAFTITGSYAGQALELSGKATVSIEDAFAALPPFRVVRVDVTPASDDAERTEIWTNVDYRHEGNWLTLSTDANGLFLLVPAE